MEITTASLSGFCFGVKNAVSAATEVAALKDNTKPLALLGEIVHNELVVNKLKSSGYKVYDRAEDVPDGAIVIIRAHGVSPKQIDILKGKGCDVNI